VLCIGFNISFTSIVTTFFHGAWAGYEWLANMGMGMDVH